MEQFFAVMSRGVRQERSLILIFSLTDPDILKQSNFADHEINIFKNFALEKLHRQRIIKKEVAFALLDSQLE